MEQLPPEKVPPNEIVSKFFDPKTAVRISKTFRKEGFREYISFVLYSNPVTLEEYCDEYYNREQSVPFWCSVKYVNEYLLDDDVNVENNIQYIGLTSINRCISFSTVVNLDESGISFDFDLDKYVGMIYRSLKLDNYENGKYEEMFEGGLEVTSFLPTLVCGYVSSYNILRNRKQSRSLIDENSAVFFSVLDEYILHLLDQHYKYGLEEPYQVHCWFRINCQYMGIYTKEFIQDISETNDWKFSMIVEKEHEFPVTQDPPANKEHGEVEYLEEIELMYMSLQKALLKYFRENRK